MRKIKREITRVRKGKDKGVRKLRNGSERWKQNHMIPNEKK